MNDWGVKCDSVLTAWYPPTVGKASSNVADFSIRTNLNLLVSNTSGMVPVEGPSGAGKSTILAAIAGIKEISAGNIEWRFPDGRFRRWDNGSTQMKGDVSISELRSRYFGFAFQEHTLLPHLSILQNLELPLKLQKLSRSIIRKKIKHHLESTFDQPNHIDFCLRKNTFPNQLSLGMKKRIALLQAWIHDPNVLFADEPTADLDDGNRVQVISSIKQWIEESKSQRLFVWITHNTDELGISEYPTKLIVADGSANLEVYSNTINFPEKNTSSFTLET